MTGNSNESLFSSVPQLNYTEPAIETSWQEFWKVVISRRSVRVFDGSPLPEKDVRDCLEAALLAPNSSNLQTWKFYWVREGSKKAELVRNCLSQPAAATAAELIVVTADWTKWKGHTERMIPLLESKGDRVPSSVKTYYKKLVPLVYTMGVWGLFGFLRKIAMFFYGLKSPIGREPTSMGEIRSWAIKSAALGCQNLMLALRAKGFDSCPMEGMDSARISRQLNLKASEDVVMVIAAGRRAPNGIYGPQFRFPSEEFIVEV